MDGLIPLDRTTVASLRTRIAHWRDTRTHRGAPMPAALWAAAVSVARRHGVGPTARALHVDHGTLRRRVDVTTGDEAPARPTFIDVGAVATAASLGPSVIAIEGARGVRLRIEVSHWTVSDLLAVTQAWGRDG